MIIPYKKPKIYGKNIDISENAIPQYILIPKSSYYNTTAVCDTQLHVQRLLYFY